MKKVLRFLPVSLGMLLGLLPGLTSAASFGTYDPRSLAMGGTGVSHANIDHAAYYNPALLSVAQEDDDFSLLVPTIGVRLHDPDELLDALEAHQDGNYETALSNSVDGFSSLPTTSNASDVANKAQLLKDSYVSISDKALDFELHGGAGIAVPGKSLGMAISAGGRVMGGVVLNVSQNDRDLMQEYIDAANDYAADGVFNGSYPNAICGTAFCSTDGKLTSTASVRGAMIIEGGLSLSHEFESLDKWSIGITPKVVSVNTYDYQVSVENSEIDEDKGKLTYDDNNIDVGIAKQVTEGWKFGLVVKNAIKKEYKTALGNTITLEPTARAGVSHHTNWTTLALDVDLTENNSLGLTGEKTQYAAVGMEFDLSLLQLRVGARHNLSAVANRESNTLSAGVGLYVFGFHIDAGVAQNDDEVAAAIQLGIQF